MAKRKTTQQFIEDAYCKHGDKYNYKLVDYKGSNKKIKIICPIHGMFEQKPNNHLNGNNCPKCSYINRGCKSTQQFIIDARKIHDDKYNYSLVQYKNSNTKIKIICPEHGVFEQKPNNHLNGNNCPKCSCKYKSIDKFIKEAKEVHSDKYDYSLVKYRNAHTKVKIICPVHGIFEQTPNHHIQGQGCKKCSYISLSNERKKDINQFIKDAYCKHGNKYNYSLVQYKNNKTKVKIICPVHGVFEQETSSHLQGCGCPKCAGQYKEKYAKNNIPLYDTYTKQLEPYGVSCRRNKEDLNVLEVKCMYCDRWYIPSIISVYSKIQCINGKQSGESNLYCSNVCKQACPTYGQNIYPKGFKDDKTNTSREVQPALRKRVLKRDNYTCQKCGTIDTELHCHHYEGVEINPIESADADNCITLCKACHNDIHKADKCGIKDYQRKECM